MCSEMEPISPREMFYWFTHLRATSAHFCTIVVSLKPSSAFPVIRGWRYRERFSFYSSLYMVFHIPGFATLLVSFANIKSKCSEGGWGQKSKL